MQFNEERDSLYRDSFKEKESLSFNKFDLIQKQKSSEEFDIKDIIDKTAGTYTKKCDDDDGLNEFEDLEDVDAILKNHYELGVKFNSEYIFSVIEMIDHDNKDEDWNLVYEEPVFKIWTAIRGSYINFKHPFIYSEMFFSNDSPITSILEAFIDPEKQIKWNPYIQKIELIQKFATNGYIFHTVYNKLCREVTERDFIEKRVILHSTDQNGKDITIVFSSSVPNLHCEEMKGVTRCETVFSILIIGEQNGVVLVKSYMQCDPKLPLLARGLINQHSSNILVSLHRSLMYYFQEEN